MSTTNHRRRLDALEAVHGINRPWTEDDEAHLSWMTGPPLLIVIREWAESIAHRRWLHEHHHQAGRRYGPGNTGAWITTAGDGWHSHTTDDERHDLTVAELVALADMTTDRPLHDALKEWVAEPDARGWPILHHWPVDYDAFTVRLQRERGKLDHHRAMDGPHAQEWRRRHPEWHPNMTPDEADAWELHLITAMAEKAKHHEG